MNFTSFYNHFRDTFICFVCSGVNFIWAYVPENEVKWFSLSVGIVLFLFSCYFLIFDIFTYRKNAE